LSSEGLASPFGRRHVVFRYSSPYHLVPTLTAQENVCLALDCAERRETTPRGGGGRWARLAFRIAPRLPKQASGGENHRVAIARLARRLALVSLATTDGAPHSEKAEG